MKLHGVNLHLRSAWSPTQRLCTAQQHATHKSPWHSGTRAAVHDNYCLLSKTLLYVPNTDLLSISNHHIHKCVCVLKGSLPLGTLQMELAR